MVVTSSSMSQNSTVSRSTQTPRPATLRALWLSGTSRSPVSPSAAVACRSAPLAPANFCCSFSCLWHCQHCLFVTNFFLRQDKQIFLSHRTDQSLRIPNSQDRSHSWRRSPCFLDGAASLARLVDSLSLRLRSRPAPSSLSCGLGVRVRAHAPFRHQTFQRKAMQI